MQKHAFEYKKQYDTVYTPFPSTEAVFRDERLVSLPNTDDISKLHYHDRYEIGFCEEGEGLFLCDGKYSTVTKGDFIFVPPACRHYSRSLSADQECKCRFFYFRSDAVEHYFPRMNDEEKTIYIKSFQNIPTVIRPAEYSSAAQLLAELVEVCRSALFYQTNAALLRLASFLVERERLFPHILWSTVNQITVGKACLQAGEIAQFLTLHYNESQTVEEMASICHLSASQLRRQFQIAYQTTPIAYRNHIRCHVAAEMLLRTAMSVSEISAQVGYSTSADFYRRFQAHYRVSPTQYRKNNQ